MAPKNAGLRGAIKRALSRYVRLRNGMFRQPRVLHEQTKVSACARIVRSRSSGRFAGAGRTRSSPRTTGHSQMAFSSSISRAASFTRKRWPVSPFVCVLQTKRERGGRGEPKQQNSKRKKKTTEAEKLAPPVENDLVV